MGKNNQAKKQIENAGRASQSSGWNTIQYNTTEIYKAPKTKKK